MTAWAGPLTTAELVELEATLLPALERHHLRLLAHGLRTLQAVAAADQGAPPTRQQLEDWADTLPALADDPDFRQAFLDQLEGSGAQLDAIATELHSSALALTLAELIQWATEQADARVKQAPGP